MYHWPYEKKLFALKNKNEASTVHEMNKFNVSINRNFSTKELLFTDRNDTLHTRLQAEHTLIIT